MNIEYGRSSFRRQLEDADQHELFVVVEFNWARHFVIPFKKVH